MTFLVWVLIIQPFRPLPALGSVWRRRLWRGLFRAGGRAALVGGIQENRGMASEVKPRIE